MMNDIRASLNLQDSNWNYVECSPFSEVNQQTPISDKFNTLQFPRYDGTTDSR